MFSIGLIADCQYHAEPGEGERKYSISDEKLAACVEHLSGMDLAFVAHLGDFIDHDWESFDTVAPIYEKLTCPKYHVLGNHDYAVADDRKAAVPARLGMAAPYYDFVVEGYRFIVIDGNDIAFHSHPEGSEAYQQAEAYYAALASESPRWNGALGEAQLKWLETRLAGAEASGEQVILFCHFPVFPENKHNLWNADEVVLLIDQHPCVKAYIDGHNHAGNYGQHGGVHYITLKGMVDTETTAYAVMDVYGDRLEIRGYGRQPSYRLDLANDSAEVSASRSNP